mgnify:CR=1 FL=1
MTGPDRICVGAIAGSFGVKGEVRLKSFCAEPSAIGDYGPLWTEDGSRSFKVKLTRPVAGGFGARLTGVSTKEEADALKGVLLYAEAGALPCTAVMTGGHGEWFMQAFSPDGLPMAELASLPPQEAAASGTTDLYAGTQAEALVALRGDGRGLNLHPDARRIALLPAQLFCPADHPLYGRAPDARLPTA